MGFMWSPLHYALFLIMMSLGVFSLVKNIKNKDYWDFIFKIKYIAIFPAVNLFTTFLFLRKGYGEANPIGKFFFANTGWFSFVILYTLTIVCLFFVFSAVYYSIFYTLPIENKLRKKNITFEQAKNITVYTSYIFFSVCYLLVYLWNLGVIR